MFALFCFVLAILASPFKSKSRLAGCHDRPAWHLRAVGIAASSLWKLAINRSAGNRFRSIPTSL